MIKKIFSTPITVILYVIIGFLALVVLNSLYCNITKRVPSFWGYSTAIIVSNSMADTINAGDYILIKSVPFKELKVGDIITFYSTDPRLNGAPNTHRIVSIDKSSVITKGDANTVNDDFSVKPDKIIGKYQGTLTLTYISKFFSNIWAFMLLIVLPLVAFIIYQFIKIIKIKIAQISE